MNMFETAFIVPVAAILLAAVGLISSAVSKAHARRTQAEQRMAMIARGMKPEDIALLLNTPLDDGKSVGDPLQRLMAIRRTGIILSSIGIGTIIFFVLLVHIENDRDIYSGAAASLIPLAVESAC